MKFFTCLALPKSLPEWVDSTEDCFHGTYVVYYDELSDGWQRIKIMSAQIVEQDLLHCMGFKNAELD